MKQACLCIFLFLFSGSYGQDSFNLKHTIGVSAGYFFTGEDGSVFFTSDGKLKKYMVSKDTLLSYDYRRFGSPSYIDSSNPEMLALYFGEQERLLLLNDKLKEITRPFFTDEIEMYDVGAVVATDRNELWLYDSYQNQVTRFNEVYIPVARSEVLSKWVSTGDRPIFMTSSPGLLFLNYPSWGILVLDRFGDYRTTYRLNGIIDFYVEDNHIYYYRDYAVMKYDMIRLDSEKLILPQVPGIQNAQIRGSYYIIQTPDSILIYTKSPNP